MLPREREALPLPCRELWSGIRQRGLKAAGKILSVAPPACDRVRVLNSLSETYHDPIVNWIRLNAAIEALRARLTNGIERAPCIPRNPPGKKHGSGTRPRLPGRLLERRMMSSGRSDGEFLPYF